MGEGEGEAGVVGVLLSTQGGPRREEGSAATAAWRGSAAHCGDSEEGDDHLAKTPWQPLIYLQICKKVLRQALAI